MRLIHAFEGAEVELLDRAQTKCFGDFYPPVSQAAIVEGRREARVEAFERTYAHKNTTYHVDAANYDHANIKAVATVVDHTLTERTSASVRCHNITEVEETAIALAFTLCYRQQRSLTVLTDSQAASRNYLQGRISQPALNVILSATNTGEHYKYTSTQNLALDYMDSGPHGTGGESGSG
ncbi:hypothetical protein MRX96_008665 [Rhipicephalus microplus]